VNISQLKPRKVTTVAVAAALAIAAAPGTAMAAAKPRPVTLTFWSWVPGIQTQVALFNKTHPGIQVHLVKTPTGAAGTYAKMFAAIKAGDPPDVGQIEFDVLPSFVATGGILDGRGNGSTSHLHGAACGRSVRTGVAVVL